MGQEDGPRRFAVGRDGAATEEAERFVGKAAANAVADAEAIAVFAALGISDDQLPALTRALDIMLADRVPEETAGKLLVGCHHSGRDPVAFAEHFVRLRSSIRR